MKRLYYLIIALITSTVILALVWHRLSVLTCEAPAPVRVPGQSAPPAVTAEPEVQAPVRADAPPRDMKDVYNRYPASDTGGNMIESWKRIKPEDKAKFTEEIDKRVEANRQRLQENPEDKKARHMLFISETLKKLAENDFNYDLGRPSPEEKKDAPQPEQ